MGRGRIPGCWTFFPEHAAGAKGFRLGCGYRVGLGSQFKKQAVKTLGRRADFIGKASGPLLWLEPHPYLAL